MAAPRILVIDDSPTILKVVQLVLSKAGFEVDLADSGATGIEMAEAEKPDLILLDFVMPKMNGYQVCRALSSNEALQGIPVVLMSAKGDQVGERFVKVMGIVDYITKPFSPEAITAVVQHTVEKYAGDGDTATGQTTNTTDADTEAGLRAAKEGKAAKDRALEDLRRGIAKQIASPLASLLALANAARDDSEPDEKSSTIDIDAEAVEEAAMRVMDDSLLTRLFGEAQPIFESAEIGPSLQGDARIVPIAEVLQLLDAQQQSGILQITRGDARIEVFFRDGRVDLAMATHVADEYFLGRYLVESELLSQEDLDGFLESRRPGSKLMGGQLVQLGYLSDNELELALKQQTRELVYEMLRWSFGRFQFTRTRDLPEAATLGALSLEVEGILMEGFRRVDEWHLIEREINNFDMVFLRNEDAVAQMGRGRLTREELAVLELVNGKNTVKELIRESKMGSYEVSKMLYRLLSIKLVRKRVKPVAV